MKVNTCERSVVCSAVREYITIRMCRLNSNAVLSVEELGFCTCMHTLKTHGHCNVEVVETVQSKPPRP